MTSCPFLLFVPPQPLILTGTAWAGQWVVDGTEDSGTEGLVWVEGGAGHPESQLVCPSEESEPRPPPMTWTAGGRERGGETESRTPAPNHPCPRPTLLPRREMWGQHLPLLTPHLCGHPRAREALRARQRGGSIPGRDGLQTQ